MKKTLIASMLLFLPRFADADDPSTPAAAQPVATASPDVVMTVMPLEVHRPR